LDFSLKYGYLLSFHFTICLEPQYKQKTLNKLAEILGI